MVKLLYTKLMSAAGALSLSMTVSGCQTDGGFPFMIGQKNNVERSMKTRPVSETTAASGFGSGGGGRNY